MPPKVSYVFLPLFLSSFRLNPSILSHSVSIGVHDQNLFTNEFQPWEYSINFSQCCTCFVWVSNWFQRCYRRIHGSTTDVNPTHS
ncbi:hypothetical protein B0H16DRAFT_1530858 [Mycena metata]|uniref:Uncharacterized protein n=1 Tax=Mycena metata TaxID=1033252 RepID=A0AAD7NGJ1_9AGAR|nr:hypothetical protein B0H16DRAFT_1530858 [Mycena metata]